MPEVTITKIFELIWIPIVVVVVSLWRRISGVETITKLIRQHDEVELVRREEERNLRDEQRKELLEAIKVNHDVLIVAINNLSARIDGLK